MNMGQGAGLSRGVRECKRACSLLLALFFITTSLHAVEDPFRPLMDALYQHESVNGTKPTGDGGRSRGDYHITRDYWTDGQRQLRREGFGYIADGLVYERDVWSRWASEVIMKAVWRRYEPAGYRAVNFEVCARLHNGSRRWREYRSTARYWGKVEPLIWRPQR